MYRLSFWFWCLILMWFLSSAAVPRFALGASGDDSKAKIISADKKRSGSFFSDFFKNGPERNRPFQLISAAQAVSSRLPDSKTNISDIPSNVTYQSREEISAQTPRTMQEAVQNAEGAVFFDQVGNGVDTTFNLRGFSEGGALVALVDGVRVNEVDGGDVNFPLIPIHDVESIQIERGSASPVYGSGAFGGVMNIVTRKPSEKPFSAFGGVEFSSFLGIHFNQGISGSIDDRLTPVGGKWFYYFDGGRDVNDGFRDNGEWRVTSFNIKIGYEFPEDGGKVFVGVKHVEDATSNPGALTLTEFHDNPEQTKTPLAGRDFRNTIVQINGDKKWWDQKITTSILADWRFNIIHFFTTSRTFADIFQTQFNPDTDRLSIKSRERGLVVQGTYEDVWGWLGSKSEIGTEFQRTLQTSLQQDFFQGMFQLSPDEGDRIAKIRGAALFWRQTIKFWEKIIVHASMRRDYYWYKIREAVAPANNFDKRWNDTTFSGGIVLKPAEYADLFANYSQGFRVPDISEIASAAEFGGGVSVGLRPEKSDSYEIGTRLRYKEAAQYKISFFLIDLKDEIVFDSNSISQANPFGQNINLARSRRTGIENRLDLNPIQELNLYGTYSWIKAYVRETDNDGSLKDGRALGLIPENRYTAGATVYPFKRMGNPYDGLSLSVSGVYTGRQHVQSYQTASEANLRAGGYWIKPYTVWNGLISFEWKGKRIYFKINNLFGERYFSRAVIASNSAFTPSNITPPGTHLFVNPGAPREYLLGATWEFE